MSAAKSRLQLERELIADIGSFTNNPLGYVMYAFPWGVGSLKEKTGPRTWQREILNEIGLRLRSGTALNDAIQIAVASGHGPGKSTLMAWIGLWAMSTFEDCRGIITANTDTQLRTKTMPELSKWYHLAVNRHWFVLTATSLYSAQEAHSKNWRLDAVPWSEHNTEAFAGLHNEGKRTLVLFDEAAAIADTVWEVTEGALTDANTQMIWVAFGNPTRNTGRFRDCFGRLAHRWWTRQIDSRSVEGVNRGYLDGLVADYGEDSDFVKARVRGVFPSAGSLQFFSVDLIERAMKRQAGKENDTYGRVLGVDIARHGDDSTVIFKRQGRRTWKPKRMSVPDLMAIADEVAQEIVDWKPDHTFIDATGMGWGVVDRLRQLGHKKITAVQTGEKAHLEARYGDRRSELHWLGREWLQEGGCLPDDKDFKEELIAVEYGYRRDRVQIESKEDMKSRGLSSPDTTDAWLLTFASPVGSTIYKAPSFRDELNVRTRRSAQAA